MFRLVIILAVAATAMAGYADSTSGSNQVGNGYGYGYSGSFSGGNGGAGGIPFPPVPQFDFNNFLQQYFDSLRRYHEQFAAHYISYAAATSDPQSKAKAKSSLTIDNANGVQHGGAYPNYGFPGGFPGYAGFQNLAGQSGFGGYGGSFGGGFGGGQEGAAASASIGPGGVHQTAGVFPENPNSPNIDNRFGSTPLGSGGGFYSVSTSSQSASSNLDGKPTSFHQATTTVNDNGKVTTYTVKKP